MEFSEVTRVDDLTPSQRAAVEHFEGPLLVLAGPGSGKTRVITRRIARLIEQGVSPREILAITFTNKASREMADRLGRLLDGPGPFVSTFHRFCARTLRDYGQALGLKPNFTIYDTSDQHQLIKAALHDLNFDAASFPPGRIGARISQAKNELITPEGFQARFAESVGTHFDAAVAQVFPLYQKKLLDANAVDFDDLLVHVAQLLRDHERLRERLDQRYRYILVDEYQDTNRAQYQIVAQLSQLYPNLCATGDPDQSIYGWRGAQIENILRFEQDFPDVNIIRLEDNFRSTPQILQVADQLISHNRFRKPKRLRTANPDGPDAELRQYFDGRQEADSIAEEMRSLVRAGKRIWSDFAIFYRVNSLSRQLETALSRHRIPYQVAGAVSFYERSEVKDLVAYLRLIENPEDRVAFLRVVNTPVRGLGKTTIDRLTRAADEQGQPLLELARNAKTVAGVSARAVLAFRVFCEMIDEFSLSAGGSIAELLEKIVQRTGYGRDWIGTLHEDELQRLHNVEELISSARQFDEAAGEEHSLTAFLEASSLVQDSDALVEQGAVTLMTLHAAKGLEFPHVYLIAVEQNLLPHERSLRQNDARELEEERRLLFVGITRAEKQLVLTHVLRRGMHGRELSTIPSDFLRELPLSTIDCTGAGLNGNPFGELPDEWTQVAQSMTRTSAGSDDKEESDDISRDDETSGMTDFDEATGKPKHRSTLAALRTALAAGSSIGGMLPGGGASHGKSPLLTTGAALEAGRHEAVPIPIGFAIGMLVRHPRFGLGSVIRVTGMSRRRTVTVKFEADGREESFVADRSPLQPVGHG